MKVVTGTKEYFPGIGKIQFEGKDSKNPLAFKWYDENKMVAGKSMKDHFRFAIAYWHSFCGDGNDPFGGPTLQYAWNNASDAITRGKQKMDAAFEFITKWESPFTAFTILTWLAKEQV